jgi:biotin carboxylase
MTMPSGRIVAIVYGPGAVGPGRLLSAATAGRCEPLILIDSREPAMVALRQAVSGLADVMDLAALTPERAAALIIARGASGITTFSDGKIALTAAIADHAGLPYASPATARALTDKSVQRALLNTAGADPVRAVAVSRPEKVERAAAEVGFPAVAKPCRGSGSEHVRVVYSTAEITRHLTALAGRALCLEEFLVGLPHPGGDWLGDYLSAETLTLAPGEHVVLALSDRLRPVPPMREGGLVMPSTLPPPRQEVARRAAVAALDAIGMSTGLAHVEIKVTADGPRILEINGRVGGYVADLMEETTGIDLVEAAMLSALGRPPVLTTEFAGFAMVCFVHAPEGATRVVRLADSSALQAVPGVWRVERQAGPGTSVSPEVGTASRVQTVLLANPSITGLRQAKATLDEILSEGNAFS